MYSAQLYWCFCCFCVAVIFRIAIALYFFVFITATRVANAVEFVTENLPPLQIENKDSGHNGAMVELINEVIKEAKITSQINVYPWPRAYQLALNEPDTFIFSMRKSTEREKLFHWVGVVYDARPMVATLSDRQDININTPQDLKNYTVGVVRGDYDEALLRSLGLNDNLYLALSYKELWQMLLLGRLDCVMTTKVVANKVMEELQIADGTVSLVYEIPNADSQLYLAASMSTSPTLIEKVMTALTSIKDDGRYQQILKKWDL